MYTYFKIRIYGWKIYFTLSIVCSSFIFDLDHGSFIIYIRHWSWVVHHLYSTLTIVCSSFIFDLDHWSFIIYIRPWSWVVHHLYSTLTIVCSCFIFDLDHGSFIINIQPRPWVVNSSFIFGYIHIQYWSVDGKYRIYLTRLRNGVKDEL